MLAELFSIEISLFLPLFVALLSLLLLRYPFGVCVCWSSLLRTSITLDYNIHYNHLKTNGMLPVTAGWVSLCPHSVFSDTLAGKDLIITGEQKLRCPFGVLLVVPWMREEQSWLFFLTFHGAGELLLITLQWWGRSDPCMGSDTTPAGKLGYLIYRLCRLHIWPLMRVWDWHSIFHGTFLEWDN